MLPIEVESAFGRGGQVGGGEACEFNLAVGVNVPPEKRRPSNWPMAGGLSLSN